ncbi:hypothetical protein HHI36_022396 [Cryptolaemus montrouzieri]|uniref:Uncharacterized protein n=1 Tax=Cryptolaemus montrouzieri TaxID=559131 RepID=A0ABD2MZR9_9CUCU
MPAKCLTCTNPITPWINDSITYTVCQEVFHAKCVELNALDLDFLELSENAWKSQGLEASHSAIEVRVTALVDEVKSLDVPTSSAISNATPEILERVKRSHNILINGIVASEDRLNDDMILEHCVDHITPTSSTYAIETFPFGSNFWRMTFSNPHIVNKILRNKKSLLGHPEFRKVKVYDDMTPQQTETSKNLRNELKLRQEQEEASITTRYVKGVPEMVKTSSSSKN